MERTTYMQSLMNKTYAEVAIEAIKSGFDGSWQRCIAREIQKDYLADHSEANEIINSCKVSGEPASKTYLKAAYLITESKIPQPA